jgi:hypothetical protein
VKPSKKNAMRAGTWAALAALVTLGSGSASAGKPSPRLDKLYASCVEAMVTATCSAMSEAGGTSAGSSNDVVFVVGVGRINGASYRRIRAYGESMCGEARKACEAQPDGNDCRVAFALWGAAAR